MASTGVASPRSQSSRPDDLVRIVWADLTGVATGYWRNFLCHPFAVSLVEDEQAAAAQIGVLHPDLVCVEMSVPFARSVPLVASVAERWHGLPLLAICHVSPSPAEDSALRQHADAVVVATAGVALRQRVIELLSGLRDRAPLGGEPSHRTEAAIDLVARSFPATVCVAAAAARCRLSVSQFSRLFRREHGQSFKQFVVGYRIDRACEQMRCSRLPLKQVGYDSGFRDLAYFSRAFRRKMGVSPSGYRAARFKD